MIKVDEISKVFRLSARQKKETAHQRNLTVAVDKISFTCRPGRIFGLLGPNGAGKTTTLRMIATILRPNSGTIRVNGYDAVQQAHEVRRQIGFLTGTTGLYQRMTSDEVIGYFGTLHGMNKELIEERKNKFYDLLDMHDFAGKRIGQLSSGMKQKVSIVRTMIHNPDILILDEPTLGLDILASENIIELIKSCREENKTVIFSTHIMSEVDLLCDDLAIIHKGRLVYNGRMDDFRKKMKSTTLTGEFIRLVKQSN